MGSLSSSRPRRSFLLARRSSWSRRSSWYSVGLWLSWLDVLGPPPSHYLGLIIHTGTIGAHCGTRVISDFQNTRTPTSGDGIDNEQHQHRWHGGRANLDDPGPPSSDGRTTTEGNSGSTALGRGSTQTGRRMASAGI